MSALADTVLKLMQLGATEEMIRAVIEGHEAARADVAPARTVRQERNHRYYESRKERLKASEIKTVETNKTGSDGEQKKGLPDPLKKTTTNPPLPTGETPKGVARQKGTTLPDDWMPKERHYEAAAKRGQPRSFVDAQAVRLRNWALSNSNRAIARKSDWDRTFDNWLDDALAKAKPPPRQAPRQSGQANYLDIARSTFDDPRSPSHERALDGEILNPGPGLSATRYAHLTVLERTGGDAGELQPQDHSGQRRTFG